jgi:imidazolonepropionase|tara:strand:+ start:4835 stop:6124 length:1290 start_codon:yes stop_codon:yes gene_type:complete
MSGMIETDLLVHSAAQLLTLAGGPQRGSALGTLGIIRSGAVAIRNGKVVEVGPSEKLRKRFRAKDEIDARGRIVLPGFVDAHTHLIWAGARVAEFEMRVAGANYMEIMEAGGGILATVRETRVASVDELVAQALPRLRSALAHGTTSMEVKTGYGLETAAELRSLAGILQLDAAQPIDLTPTFLGAHAFPPEYSDDHDGYTELVCAEMLPAVRDWWAANADERRLPFVDVFCETGVFTPAQSRRILERAQALGFPLKIHADEFDGLGGTGIAVELGATSADHLVHTPPEDIAALGRSETVAVALPCSPFGLAEAEYTPARAILEADGILALATDMNPGPAWCESMQFVLALGCRYLRLTPAQAIAAATINAAAAIGRAGQVGSLEAGKQADLVLLGASDYRHLGYRFGGNLVEVVIKAGDVVLRNTALT